MFIYELILQKLADITGSKAYERFTGSQIAKIYQTKNLVYNNTEVSLKFIVLVSHYILVRYIYVK